MKPLLKTSLVPVSLLASLLLVASECACAEGLRFIDKGGKTELNISRMRASVVKTVLGDTRRVASLVGDFSEGFVLINYHDGSCRFMSRVGKFLPGRFTEAKPFSNGYAAVKVNGLWGFIDKTGCICISAKYLDVQSFSEERAAVWNGQAWGFIDTCGKLVIPQKYVRVLPFSEHLAAVVPIWDGVSVTNSYGIQFPSMLIGFIDDRGRMAISPRFKFASSFSEGLAFARESSSADASIQYIDCCGRTVFSIPSSAHIVPGGDVCVTACEYDSSTSKCIDATCGAYRTDRRWMFAMAHGLAPISQDGRYGFINKDGRIQIQPKFTSVAPFSSEGISLVSVGTGRLRRYGYIDVTGHYLVKPTFQRAEPFADGLAVVTENGLKGYIDSTGRYVIKPKYRVAHSFRGGLARIGEESEYF